MIAFFYPVGFVSNTDYASAVGRVRVLETHFLTRTDFERILETENDDDVFRVLELADYRFPLEGKGAAYLGIIHHNITYLMDFAESLFPQKDKWLSRYFRTGIDFINLKEMAKFELEEIDTEPLYREGGTIETSLFSEKSNEEIVDYLPAVYQGICREYIRLKNKQEISRYRDIGLFYDAHKYSVLLKIARESTSDFLIRFTKIRIDCLNIEILLRLIERDTKSVKSTVFIDNGFIEKSRFEEFISGSREDITGFFSDTPYSAYMQRIQERTEGLEKVLAIEQEISKIKRDFLSYAQYITFGPEVIFSYFFMKMKEIQNIKTVFLAREQNVDIEIIKSRLDI